MPLSPPALRSPLHTRNIECKGYQRADGLWDIEGHLVDVKAYSFVNEWRGEVTPGIPLHEMWVRLTVDDTFTVQAVEAATDNSPFAICANAAPNFQQLKGLRIGRGWNRTVRNLLGGTQGCTHILQLLPQMATVSLQTIRASRRVQKPEPRDAQAAEPAERLPEVQNRAAARAKPVSREAQTAQQRPRQLDSCYAWSTEREVVRRWMPKFYTGKP